MHKFLPILVFLSIIEAILFLIFIGILARVPYEPMILSGIMVIFLLLLVLLMVIIYRGIDRLRKTIYGHKGS